MVKSHLPDGRRLVKSMSVFAFVWLFPLLLSAQETFRDNFSAVSYSNNNGTRNFATAWQENGDDNSPSSGRIDINSNQLRFDNLDNAFISRSLNLQNASNVVLTLNYIRTSGDESIDVQLWNGSSWNTIANLAGTGTVNYSLAATEISANSAIRFISGSGSWSNGEIIFVDNVLFTATFAPSLSINDISVYEADGSATFTVTLTNNASGGFTVNFATSNGTAIAGSDYTTTTGSLSFTGTSGQTRTITVPLINDLIPEFQVETFTVTLSGPSNPAVILTDASGEASIADDEYLFNTPLVLKEEFDGYVDYRTTGGTLRTQPNTGDACAVTTTSSATLVGTVPATAYIEKAILYWSHSGATPDTQVLLDGNTIDAQFLYGTSLTNRNFYGGRSDITTYLRSLSNLSTHNFTFSGLTIDTGGNYCSTATVLGAWSIMVFYADSTLPASTINVYEGFSGESNSSSSYTLGGFFAIGASGAKTTVLSWEGDQTLSNNERLSVTTGLGTFTLAGDGDNNGLLVNNPFNSTIFDNTVIPTMNNTAAHGLDLDTYNVSPYVTPGESSVTTTVQSGQDFVIVNAVVLKVPSNLVTGIVFEDVNYGGGVGRNRITASGVPLQGVTMELYNGSGTLREATTTNASGRYVFAGMANGTYTIRAVNNSVRSSRPGGAVCNQCLPVQTFKTDFILGILQENTNLVGGTNPAGADPGPGILAGAQSRSSLTIINQGVAGMDFGFNFNTIVNTNPNNQGSLEQFIVNANNLGETGLDILPNAIFNPAAGEDTSIFMIPPTGDALGRTADANYIGGRFRININTGSLSRISGTDTKIDGRTQTAYSGDTNAGVAGAGGTAVGISATLLPTFPRPEIEVYRAGGDVMISDGNSVTIRNLAVYANNNAAIKSENGSLSVVSNLLGVNANGVNGGAVLMGVNMIGGSITVDGNFIATNADTGIRLNGGTSAIIRNNHITANGNDPCDDNIQLVSGSGISILQNLIENAAANGIEGAGFTGGAVISQNTITRSGQNGGICTVRENSGIRLHGNNSAITNNIIHSNGGAGIVLAGGNTTGNRISQNSIYANGTAAMALGIDLDISNAMGDGVTLNDTGDGDSGPNASLNFPIISAAYLEAGQVVITGFARPGALVEFFLTDINQGTAMMGANRMGKLMDYGEGQTYIGSFTEGSGSDLDGGSGNYMDIDGNADNTNRFEFRVPAIPGILLNSYLTATATLANSTSEFSPMGQVKIKSVITNRRITYRVNPS